MHPATLHGVACLRHLRNQWPWISLKGHSRSSILVGYQSKAPIHIPISGHSTATWTLFCTVSDIGRLKCRKSTIFPNPLLFRLKLEGGVWSRSIMLGSAESKKVMLIRREIIFAEFQPICDHVTSTSQTDHRQTDGQADNLPWQYRAPLGFAQ